MVRNPSAPEPVRPDVLVPVPAAFGEAKQGQIGAERPLDEPVDPGARLDRDRVAVRSRVRHEVPSARAHGVPEFGLVAFEPLAVPVEVIETRLALGC